MKKYCDYCKENIEISKIQQWGAHRRNCKSNPNREEYLKKLKESANDENKKKVLSDKRKLRENWITFKQNCSKCDAEFELTVTENSYNKGKYKKFCSRSCSNSRIHSEETKKKISVKAKDNIRKGISNKPSGCVRYGADHHNWVKRITTECERCHKLFEHRITEDRKYCSRKCGGGYNENSTNKHRTNYKGYWMDSGLELEFAKRCDELGLKWIKNTKIAIDYIDGNHKLRKYYPDFHLYEIDEWVETKGKFYENELDYYKKKRMEELGFKFQYIYNAKTFTPA